MSAASSLRAVIVGGLSVLAVIGASIGLVVRSPSPSPPWFLALPRGDAPVFFITAEAPPVRKLKRAGATRNAIVARPGYPLRQQLVVPPAGALDVSMATICAPAIDCQGSATFTIRLHDGTGRHQLLHATVPTTQPRWQTRQVDLTRWTGEHVEVSFSVSIVNGARDRLGPIAVWGEPLPLGTREPRPNIVLVSIDTLRADHLGCYGHTRPTSPHLDQLAAEGVRFAQAISQAPWTTPSHMSLFTGLYPSTHGVNQDWDAFKAFNQGAGSYRTIGAGVQTLTEILRANGYRTFASTGGGTIAGILGFNRGFDVYREDLGAVNVESKELLNQWLGELQHSPFFLFFHTFHVHAPYRSTSFVDGLMTEPQRQELERVFAIQNLQNPIESLRAVLDANQLLRPEVTAALYDGAIHATDASLGELFARLHELGLYDRTLIVVTSDHGEEFADHDPNLFYDAHCRTVYDELVHVPLIMRIPGREKPGTVVDQQVELIDVAPTILDLIGVAAPPFEGRSLVPLLNGGNEPVAPALSEATCTGAEWKALRTGNFKYVTRFTVPAGERSGMPGPMESEALFDLRSDPHEQQPLDDPSRTLAMRQALHHQLNQMMASTASQVPISPELRERLRTLGYLE